MEVKAGGMNPDRFGFKFDEEGDREYFPIPYDWSGWEFPGYGRSSKEGMKSYYKNKLITN